MAEAPPRGVVVASAPGKVMLAGEYAVLDGGRALVAAVDRRAVATVWPAPPADRPAPSEFLRAARAVVAAAHGDVVAAGFDRLTVDSDALRDGPIKLGLGSSAAATVAAITAVTAAAGLALAADEVAALALAAHAEAQGERGARGSGADVLASAHGGVIDVRRAHGGPRVRAHALPTELELTFAWTAQPADTATLVTAVAAARARQPAAVARALAAIAAAADALAAADNAAAAIEAIAAGHAAMVALAEATGVDLVPPAVSELARRLAPLGAAAKTTGAGGGDVVLLAAPATVDPATLAATATACGLRPLALAVDRVGVTARPAA